MIEYTINDIGKLLTVALERLDDLETKLEDLAEGQARLEEAIANVSLPGSNYGIEDYE